MKFESTEKIKQSFTLSKKKYKTRFLLPIRFLFLMKKNNIFWLIISLLSALLIVSCIDNKPSGDFVISGKIVGAAAKNLILEEITPDNSIRIDSAIIGNDGQFEFKYLPDQPGIFCLKLPSKGLITFFAEKSSMLELKADLKSFPGKYEISGNRGSELIHEYFTKTAVNQVTLDSLSSIYTNSQHLNNFYKIKSSLDSTFAILLENQRHFTTELIRKNPTEIPALLLLNQYFGNTKLINADENAGLFFLLDSNLMSRYPENNHVQNHHNRVIALKAQHEEMKKAEALLGTGKPAPEISLPGFDGKIIRLSSFKGKTVLLFFWASWSPPSRAAMQQLKQFYKQKNDSYFWIFAISFDHVEKFWKAAINLEQTPWLNACDLRGLYSPVKKLYNIPDELPYFYLIDKEGKIVAKSEKISEILKIVR